VEENFTVTLTNLNEPATGAVSVTGTPVIGQTLSVSNTLSDPDGLGTITYQWYRDGQPIVLGGTLKDGVDGVDGLNCANQMVLSSDGNFAYVTGTTDDAVSWYKRNASTGALTYAGVLKDGINGVYGLDGASGLTLSSDGNHLYVTGHGANAVSWFKRNASTGALTYLGILFDGVDGVDGLDSASGVTLSSDGKHAYVTGTTDDAVSWYKRNASTGALTYAGVLKDGINGVYGLDGAIGLTLSSDGNQLYVTGRAANAVSWYKRNTSTGALTYAGMLKDGVNGVDGLDDARDLTLSADGNFAYVTGISDDAVSWYKRNASTGALTYRGMLKDGVGGVDGFDNAHSLALSTDENHLYVTGWKDDAVSWYQRNANTGALTYGGMLQDGVNGVDGLSSANGVRLSSDGNHAYVTGWHDKAVSWFTRDPLTGALSYGPVSGANYTLTAADLGKTITVVASYVDGGSTAESVTSTATSMVTAPALSDSNFMTAVNLWFANQAEAISTYGHISNWNVSSVTNMAYAFKDRTNFNEDISGWDMSNVTTIGGMFQGASLFNQPIGNWNVSKVEWMTEAFSGASSFNQPIGNWDVSAVHQMGYMFANATSFNQNIGDWDTSSVTIMNGMFSGATSFNKPIGNWDVSAVEAMGYMFRDATSFDQDISSWNVSNVSVMHSMFKGATSFNQPIGIWDVSSANKTWAMFQNADSFNRFLGDWNSSSVTNMSYMFAGADSFNSSIAGWDIKNVNNFENMFSDNQLSKVIKKEIQLAFSSNPNWPYDWADDEPYEPGEGDGDGHETMEPGDGDGGGGDTSKPESFELELRGQVISENRPAGTEVGRFVIYNESGEDVSSDFEFEISSSSGNVPEKVTPSEDQGGEDGSSPVNGITSLTFNRQNWFTLSNVSLKMENISGGTQAFEWPKQAFSFDQRYAIDIARDDKTKAKVNDNKAGDPANLFEDWGEISGDTIRIGDNWKISSIETTNGKVEKFTIDYSMSADTEATTGTTHPSFTIDKDGSPENASFFGL
jgi:surface protein